MQAPVANEKRALAPSTLIAVWICTAIPRNLYAVMMKPAVITEQWELATNLLQHGALGVEGSVSTRFEPLYPLFLAAARAASGNRIAAVQLIQIAVGSMAAVCLYGLTVTLTSNRRAATLAAALFACYPLLIRHAADGKDAALVTVLLTAFCWTFVRAQSVAGAVLAGVWLGLATLTRTMILPLVVLASLVWLLEGRVRAAAALAITACLLFTPYAVRNMRLNGQMMPTRGGQNLQNSNSPYTAGIVPAYPADLLSDEGNRILTQEEVGNEPPGPALERRQDETLRRRAWQYVRGHPRQATVLRLRNILYLFSPLLVPRHEWVEDIDRDLTLVPERYVSVEHGIPRSRLSEVVYSASYTPVLVLALAGIVWRRRELRRDCILWCVVATYVCVYAVFVPSTFYRVPMDFVLLFYAAVALDKVASGRQTADPSDSRELERHRDPRGEARS